MARPRTFDESEVLRRARTAFQEHGYAATSIQDLTAATGLQRSSLYGTFGDKHELFVRSISQYCEENIGAAIDNLAGEDADAFTRLERHLLVTPSDSPGPRRGCLLAKATAELASEDPDVARVAADAYAAYERAFVDCFRGAQAVGDIRDDIDPAGGGAMLLAVMRGIEALGRAGHPTSSLQAIVDAALKSVATPGTR
jgi:TetR/AcrR family transcriptional regulator, transcriptional repressor for nem operon